MFTHTSDAVIPIQFLRKSFETLQRILHFITAVQSEGGCMSLQQTCDSKVGLDSKVICKYLVQGLRLQPDLSPGFCPWPT